MRISMAFLLMLAFGGGAVAQATEATAPSPVRLDLALSALQEVESGCRMSFLVTNEMAAELEDLSLEIAVFGERGGLDRMLRLNFGLLIEGKTRVRQFDLTDTPCTAIGSVLLNDVAVCEGGHLAPIDCLRAVRLAADGPVPFGL